jgi:hypothetical protein
MLGTAELPAQDGMGEQGIARIHQFRPDPLHETNFRTFRIRIINGGNYLRLLT